MDYRPWTKKLLPLTSKKPPYQFGAFIFMYAACYDSFWVGYFLIQPSKTKFGIIRTENNTA